MEIDHVLNFKRWIKLGDLQGREDSILSKLNSVSKEMNIFVRHEEVNLNRMRQHQRETEVKNTLTKGQIMEGLENQPVEIDDIFPDNNEKLHNFWIGEWHN